MARGIHKLTDLGCRTATGPKFLSDGGGLYLNVTGTNAKSWRFVWRKGNKRSEMGLGSYPAVSLAQARAKASAFREVVAAGGNPLEDKRSETVPTFGECVEMFLSTMEGQWKNAKHRAQWRTTLETYAGALAARSVGEIATRDVLGALTPIWQTRPETASRLRGRIERVLDYAKARGWRQGENPALWRGHLAHVLPSRSKLTRGHHAAMPYREVPDFVALIRGSSSVAARALEFLILTAARSGEVLEARWDEIDLDNALWSVPGERMKMGRPHRVPLSAAAMQILMPLFEVRISEFVFPGQKAGRPQSNMAYAMLMRRLRVTAYTVHGFRSAFRDWVGDETTYPRELAEQALAHQVGNEVERAYRRSDALSKRRVMMEEWSRFCTSHVE